MLFFPMLLFSLVQYWRMGKAFPNFWTVKLLGTVLGLLGIPALYYTYTGALGVYADWFNIAIFYLVAALVYWLETKLLQMGKPGSFRLAPMILLALGAAFVMLTDYPLNLPLFQP